MLPLSFAQHAPVARGASLSRGITDEGHGGGIAYFTSTEYLIFQLKLFPRIPFYKNKLLEFSTLFV